MAQCRVNPTGQERALIADGDDDRDIASSCVRPKLQEELSKDVERHKGHRTGRFKKRRDIVCEGTTYA